MHPGKKMTICALVALVLPGCVMGIPDAGPAPPPPPKPCQIWVKIDNGQWHCYERGEVLRELKKMTPPG